MNNETIEVMMRHRSVRNFTNKIIDNELLNKITTCGLRASNTGNMQLYSVIATQEEPLRSELGKLHFGQCSTAPMMLTICVDVNRYHHYCRINDCEEPYGNFLWLNSALVDASLAAQNICLAAESEGLGCCFLGTVMYNTAQIASLLKCPKGVVPVIAIAMGYPAEEPRLSERLGLDAVLHHEVYHDPTDDDIRRTHQVRDNDPFNQEMVKQNGTRNYCEIFTTIRYPKEQNINISESLLAFVKEQGLM